MKIRPILAFAAIVTVAASAAGAGTAAPARATDSPAAIARHILGHAPTGLAARVVTRGFVRVANDANYPPQSSVDQSTGKLVGFDVEVASRVAAILGLGIRFKNPAWETIPANLQAHKYYDVSIGSMEITPARQGIIDFADPYYYMPAQVFVKKGGTQIHAVTDLFGKRVGVGAGTPYRDFLRRYPQIKVRTYTTDADAFPDLRNGRIKFVLTARATGQQAIHYGQPFQFSGHALFHVRMAFAVGKGQTDWLALLDHSVRTMHRDGSLSALSRTWYHGRDWTVWRWRR